MDIISSTNAIHLYYNLKETPEPWKKILHLEDEFISNRVILKTLRLQKILIIDESVIKINEAAVDIVSKDDRFSKYRPHLDDKGYMEFTTS